MNPRENGNIRPKSTVDDGELPPLPPRSGRRSMRHHQHLSDREVQVRNHATSLLGVPSRGASTSTLENKSKKKRLVDDSSRIHKAESGPRPWQNSSWDKAEMKTFMHETDDENIQHSLPSVEEVRMNSPRTVVDKREKRRIVRTIAMIGVALSVAFVIGLGSLLSRDDDSAPLKDSEATESGVSQRMDEITVFLGNGISSPEALADSGTPQYAAANWIAHVDPLRYDIPGTNVSGEDSYHFVQRYVLAVLYYALGGPDWKFDLNFLSEDHECAWFSRKSPLTGGEYSAGIMCGNSLRVEDILMPGNSLTGVVPPELQFLTEINFLSLEANKIAGPFPGSVRNLSKLEFLNLNDNDLTGNLPSWLEELEQLKVLGLSNNELDGSIPRWHLPLRTLALDGNNLTGSLLPINDLTGLKYAYLDENRFDDVLDRTFLAGLNNLVELGLSNNNLLGPFPSHLLDSETLLVLDLRNNGLTGVFPDHISEDLTLRFLSIDGNNIDTSDGVPPFVQDIMDSSDSYTRSPSSFSFY